MSVQLNWSASFGASSYRVYRSTAQGQETLYISGVSVNTYTDTAVSPGMTYWYFVTAVNASGESLHSNEVSITTSPLGTVATNTVLASSINPMVVGNVVTFYAAVAPQTFVGQYPTGTVTFTVDGVFLGTAPLVNGIATIATGLLAGSRVIGASYAGDSTFSASVAPTLTQVAAASWSAPWQPVGINVLSNGLSNNGVFDNTAAANALYASMRDGDLLHFPAGTYNFSAPVTPKDAGRGNWGMIGDTDSSGAPSTILTTTNNINLWNVSSSSIFQVRNCQFIAPTGSAAGNNAGFFANNWEAGGLADNCVFRGWFGMWLQQCFDTSIRHCTFTGYGSAVNQVITTQGGPDLLGWGVAGAVSIGLLNFQPTEACVTDCTFTNWTEGIRTAGSGLSVLRSTFAGCSLGTRLGSEEDAFNFNLGGCVVADSTFTACDCGIYCQNVAGMLFLDNTVTGSNAAPSGQSQYGIWTSAKASSYTTQTVNGSHSQAGLFVHAATNYSSFYANAVTNSLGTATLIQAGTTQCTFAATAMPNLISDLEHLTAFNSVAANWNVVNVSTSGIPSNGTDGYALMQALITAQAGTPTLFYFPYGNYAFSHVLDFSSLPKFALYGDGISASSIRGLGTAGNGFVAPNPVITADYGTGAGTFRIQGIDLVSSVYFKNVALSVIEDCATGSNTGIPAIKLVNPFQCGIRNVTYGGGNFDRIGLMASGMMGLTLECCSALGLSEALRASGFGLRIVANRCEVNRTAFNFGVDQNGQPAALTDASAAGCSFEADDYDQSIANCVGCFFAATGSQGHDLSPSGTSLAGYTVSNSSDCTFAACSVGGAHLTAAYLVMASSSDLLFVSDQAANNPSTLPKFVNQGAPNVQEVSFLTV